MSEPSEPRAFKWVGQRIVRPDGADKVTGRAAFGADRRLPGMLHGRVLRSPHAHARILRIDASAARALPGVKAVVVGADLPLPRRESGGGGESPVDYRDLAENVLARDKVLYVGHAVAAVAATSARTAEQALRRIAVAYEPLPPVLDLERGLDPDAPVLHDHLFTHGVEPRPTRPSNVAKRTLLERGDVEAGFAAADAVVEGEFRTETVHQGYIEPHAAVAEPAQDGHLTVWCCTQGPFMVRAHVAKLLGLPIGHVKVIPSEIGGGFGGKTTVYVEPIAAALAQRAGRPVRLVMSREDVFRASGPAPASRIRLRVGARRDGRIVAVDASLAYEAGAFPGSPVEAGAMCLLAPYDVEAFRIEALDVCVNKAKTTAYRAPGAPMAAFAAESLLDELAAKLGLDPLELRLRNAAKKDTRAAYGPRYREIGFLETLEAARAHPHWSAPLGANEGRGVACGFWFNGGQSSSASVALNEDGTLSLVAGTPDIGGSRASLALMCAEELDVDPARIRPVIADTETAGYSDMTGGSRVTFATGMAVIEATRALVRQLRERAAKLLDVPVDEVVWKEGAAQPAGGTGRILALEELARDALRTGGPLVGQASLTARGVGPAFATHLVDVSVDPDTGKVDVVRYTAIQDAGKAIHPSYVEGQMQGGVVQGIGWALNEEYVFDAKGQLANPGFLDYRMPVALDVPMIDTVIVEVPNPRHPHGVRGVGEVPIVPPIAAIANAIHAATGLRLRHAPFSPPRVLEALLTRTSGLARAAR
ncbi:MAG TPA: xanthine dehydrogenase family protein molybdopterin-binding subunit [Myxococcota bacterium]|nr:xanthine dehydrogenase family protein molybdopterin-binding subunit [Myxococcota bacterium]